MGQPAIKSSGFCSEEKLLIMCFDALEVNIANSCLGLHKEIEMTDMGRMCACECVWETGDGGRE